MKLVEKEIVEDYEKSLGSLYIDNLLLKSKKKRSLPLVWPIFVIRAPVPWHQSKVTATHFMEHDLFVTNPIACSIRSIWHDKYRFTRIVKVSEIAGELPIPALEIADRIRRACYTAKKQLIEEWLADVAELFLQKKEAWSGYFDKTPNASTMLVRRYFRSVNNLLSRQLRYIVLQTLMEFRDFLVLYASGNTFEGEYQDLTFTR